MASPTKPARPPRKTTRPPDRQTAQPAGDYADAFPNSSKVYVDGPGGIRVPMREIALSGGEPPLRGYAPSGAGGHDGRNGLPALRKDWIAARAVTLSETNGPKLNGSSSGGVPAPSVAPL